MFVSFHSFLYPLSFSSGHYSIALGRIGCLSVGCSTIGARLRFFSVPEGSIVDRKVANLKRPLAFFSPIRKSRLVPLTSNYVVTRCLQRDYCRWHLAPPVVDKMPTNWGESGCCIINFIWERVAAQVVASGFCRFSQTQMFARLMPTLYTLYLRPIRDQRIVPSYPIGLTRDKIKENINVTFLCLFACHCRRANHEILQYLTKEQTKFVSRKRKKTVLQEQCN